MLKSKQPETSSGMRWLSRFSGFLWFDQRCPLCTSILFTEAEHQALDRLLTLLAFHPVRCANCFRRYYCFAKS
jgi:predicted DCC family thiol-disulfide oxidoreductase YuxK